LSLLLVVGARPNFMKIAPVYSALEEIGLEPTLVHTGQHYDRRMSEVFFEQLGMPEPSIHLQVGSDNHARQTARLMERFDEVCEERSPKLVIAGGDVNSTLAAALVAAKRNVPVGHVESGLRSFDRTMPEELNRIVTDHLSTLLFTTEESGNRNLRAEGIAEEKIHFVGNGMVDTLIRHLDAAKELHAWEAFELERGGYGLVTLHRPANVDRPESFRPLLEALVEISREIPLVFPVHPRTRAQIDELSPELPSTLRLAGPLPYLEFLGLMFGARVVLTDSGGIQEETTALGVPCLTVRENTERPITLEAGSNRLVGTEPAAVVEAVRELLGSEPPERRPPVPLWDGRAGERTAQVIRDFLTQEAESGSRE